MRCGAGVLVCRKSEHQPAGLHSLSRTAALLLASSIPPLLRLSGKTQFIVPESSGRNASSICHMGKLDGKIALITGGSTGIGLAAAKLFAQEGAQVIVTGRNSGSIAAAQKELGPSALAI